MRMLAEDELRDAVLLIFANKQVSCTSLPSSGCMLASSTSSEGALACVDVIDGPSFASLRETIKFGFISCVDRC